ncbi:universal stress protein [Geodermatophilus sp. DF01-2]|uniref:universal stress protein n=1 Tax=Geodermatophilus sp. DF01-2 TaxID=2559610 RepID=UPI001072F929|nr:universal stress protein [Geodermatophilus sp. DF01_2]TFV63954.1 universal stress protein [Geodermatophilus sp. DF01_2]
MTGNGSTGSTTDAVADSVGAPGVEENLRSVTGVVVGDDGSAASRDAVLWAAEDAARRGAPLHVVRCWQMTTAPQPGSWKVGYIPPLEDWEQAVIRELDAAWASLRDRVPELRLHAVHGRPGRVLVEASRDADLVVVGSRGHGRLADLVLGSVATDVAREAQCPVVIVRPRTDRPGEDDATRAG